MRKPVPETSGPEPSGSKPFTPRAQPERFESKRDDVARKIKGLECDRRSKEIDLHSKPGAQEQRIRFDGPLGLIAGGGKLPFDIIRILQQQNIPYVTAALDGFADAGLIQQKEDFSVGIGSLGTFMDRMKDAGVSDLLMAGKVTRPALGQLSVDARGAAFLAKLTLKAGLKVPDKFTGKLTGKITDKFTGKTPEKALGDNVLLEALKDTLSGHGFRLHGVGDITTALFVEPGLLTESLSGPLPHPLESVTADGEYGAYTNDIAHGVRIAKQIGRLDIGQAVVVHQGEVLAVEAAEGTDALLGRLKDIPRSGTGGVLVKVAKPQQDHRLDLPTVGLTTVQNAIKAGLRLIAMESGATLLLQRRACIEAANAAGLALIGLDLSTAYHDEETANGGTDGSGL